MEAFRYIREFDNESLESYLKLNNINITNDMGESLLHEAVREANDFAFDLLLKNYIDINIKNSVGNTALMYAIIYNRLGYFKRLVKEGADLNLCNNKGESPIMMSLNKNHIEMAQILFDFNVNLDVSNENDENIYFSIVRSHNLDFLKKLLPSNSVYLNSLNFTKRTLLHQAVMISDYNIASYLLDAGILANVADNFGETPLFFAARNGDLEMINLLLSKGALLRKVNSFFETVFDVAKKDVVEYLKYKENDVSYTKYLKKYPLHIATIYNDYVRARQLVSKYNLDKTDIYGYKPLEYAKKLGYSEIEKMFLQVLEHKNKR